MKKLLLLLLCFPILLVGQQIIEENGGIYYKTNYLGKDMKFQILEEQDTEEMGFATRSITVDVSACDCVNIYNRICKSWNSASDIGKLVLLAEFVYYDSYDRCLKFSESESIRCKNYWKMLGNCKNMQEE